MLEAIADAGNGTYYFIEQSENIPEAFADALGGLLSVCAQNIELRITPCSGCMIKELHTGFPKRNDGDDTIITVPDLYAEVRCLAMACCIVVLNFPPQYCLYGC